MKLFTSLIIIAVCIGTYFIYISPTYSYIQALSAQKDTYNQVLQTAKDVASKRDQAMASYNAISSDNLSRLSKIVPVDFNSVTFVNHLSTIASKYGLVVAGMQIIEQDSSGQQIVAPSATSYKTKNVTFSIKGQYSAFVSFLKDLESGLYLVDVTGLSIKRDTTDKTGSLFEFNVNLNTYSLN